MTKAIFWDNDGVLVETEHLYYRATAEILLEIGIELDRRSFIDLSLRQGRSALESARERGLSEVEMEELRLRRNRRYSQLLRTEARPIDGVEEILSALHGRVMMAIVTSSLREHFEIIHRSTGLLRFFDFVLTREDYQRSKPHPEPYLTALEKSGLTAEECFVVEDSERGLQAADAAGLRCLVIPGELTRNGDFSAAHRILKDAGEIPGELWGPGSAQD